MRPAFCVAWRPDGAARAQAWDYVETHLKSTGYPIFVADANWQEPFSRAASRNAAAKGAVYAGHDVLIFHDADMLAPAQVYSEIAAQAMGYRRMVIGYTEYRALNRGHTKAVLTKGADPFVVRTVHRTWAWSVGGILAIHADLFQDLGGYDERFRGWGCEDTAFAVACGVVLGQNLRSPAASVHLWHPHASETVDEAELAGNSALLSRYNSLTGIDDYRALRET